jgi:hypothetical protein
MGAMRCPPGQHILRRMCFCASKTHHQQFTVFMIIPVYLEVSGEFAVIIPFSALLR